VFYCLTTLLTPCAVGVVGSRQLEYFGSFAALAALAFWLWSTEQAGAGALSIDVEDTDGLTTATMPVVVAEDGAAVTMPDGHASLQSAAEE
jgi:hypothetical protein